jgi:hypothetical protein
MLRILSALLFTISAAHAADQVQLKMVSGEVIAGEIVSEDDKQITLKRVMAGKKGPMTVTMSYEREKIAEVVAMPSAKDEYVKKAAAAGATAKDQLALARWCQENNLSEQAIEHAKKAAALDVTDTASRDFLGGLGQYELDGKWLNEADYMAATGKVKYGGKLVTAKEAEELKLKAVEKEAADELESKGNRIASIDKRLAANQQDSAELDAKIKKLNDEMTSAEASVRDYERAQHDLTLAEGNLANQRQMLANQPGVAGNMTPFQNAVDKAQKAVSETKAKSAGAAGTVTRCKNQLKELEQKKAALVKKATELQADRTRAAAELQKANEEAAKAGAKKP